MATESIAARGNNIQDPETGRSVTALLVSILADLNTLKTAHNTHTHAVSGAVAAATTDHLVGNFNTTA